MQPISTDEALLVFDKWSKEQTTVFCKGRCWGWEVYVKGYIIEASPEKIVIQTADKWGALGIQLHLEDLNCFYAEPREMPPELRQGLSDADSRRSLIGIGLPLRVPLSLLDTYNPGNPPRRETLFFCELPPE